MASKIKSIFKRQASNQQFPPPMELTFENHDESSAIMNEMQEMPRDFILGPVDDKESSRDATVSFANAILNEPNVATEKRNEKLNSAIMADGALSLGTIEDLLRCPVCLERLKSPRMMPCQHTFCLECLEEQLVYSFNEDRIIKCPLCKLTLADSPPANLPTNLYIESLLRTLKNCEAESPSRLEATNSLVNVNPFSSPHLASSATGMASNGDPTSSVLTKESKLLQSETRCVKCETACDRDNRCKHCKQIFCSVCWVGHMDELKDQLPNIVEQLRNTTIRFGHRVDEYKSRLVQLTDYIERDIETRINELRQERVERINQAEKSAAKGLQMADDLKNKILRAHEEVVLHQEIKFDTLADNQEKVKTFLALHRRASELMSAVAVWDPELSDGCDENDDKYKPEIGTSPEDTWLHYRSRPFAPKMVVNRGLLQRPAGIALDPWKKHLFIACPGTRQVVVLDKKYRVLRRIQHQDMLSPQGVAFLEDFEELFVTDKWRHCVHVFNRKGELLRQICTKGHGEGQLKSPEGIAAHPTRSLLYVADTGNDRIQILTPDGTAYGEIGPTGKAETNVTPTGVTVINRSTHFYQPTDVAVTENHVYVADSANHKVKIFNHEANLVRTIGTPGSLRGLFRSPESIAVDSKGNVIVGDSGNARIQIFTPFGELLRVLGSRGRREGELGWVSGLLVKENLDIVVVDGKNYTVQIF